MVGHDDVTGYCMPTDHQDIEPFIDTIISFGDLYE